jgi:hypothetical protein
MRRSSLRLQVRPAFLMRLPFACFMLLAVLAAAGSPPVAAQTATGTLNASINGLARLTISSAALTFPDADPDTVPSVQATQGPIAITAKARTTANGSVTLTLVASDQLRSGINTIPATNVTWTATGPGFNAGTLNAAAAQTVAIWTGPGIHSGTQTYFFRNLWSYTTGTYTVTVTYTLSAA